MRVHKIRSMIILFLAFMFDTYSTYYHAIIKGVGLHNETNLFVKIFWSNGYWIEYLIYDSLILTGVLTWFWIVLSFVDWLDSKVKEKDYVYNRFQYWFMWVLIPITEYYWAIGFIKGGLSWIL